MHTLPCTCTRATHTHTCTHMRGRTHVRAHTYAYTAMYTHMCTCMPPHTCTHAHTCVGTHTHVPVTGAFVWGSLGRGKLSLGTSLQPLWTEAVGWGSLSSPRVGGVGCPHQLLSLRCGCPPQSTTGPGVGSPAGRNGMCVPPEGLREGHVGAGAISGNPGLDSS